MMKATLETTLVVALSLAMTLQLTAEAFMKDERRRSRGFRPLRRVRSAAKPGTARYALDAFLQ